MTEEFSTRNPTLHLATQKGAGFFQKIFFRQMEKMEKGTLEISTARGKFHLGKDNEGDQKGSLIVKNSAFFRKACLGGSLGVADSYADGDWETDDLVGLFRLFLQNLKILDGMEGGLATILNKLARWSYEISQRNTERGSRRNIALHYDLGNDFYELMLDPTMTYSCALFASEKSTLEEAQIAKYDSILDQLETTAEHHLLEIGTGWGGFALRAAERHGCRVTTTTISERQFEFAVARIKERKLEDHIQVIRKDYRRLEGSFDRVVSIEMIEAVGHEYLPAYFGKISQLLKQDGAALIQAITMPDHRYARYLKEVDYIRARVFPGSCVPSVTAMLEAVSKQSDLRPVSIKDIGLNYVVTLQKWRAQFLANLEKIKGLGYKEQFLRSWEYYLCYCQAGFKESYTSDVHLMLNKKGCGLGRAMP
jgi:cyclopropane-fatty-acyl-phospholipid synthase